MITAQDIINDARFRVITRIVTLMRKIDAYLETGNKRLMTDPKESVVLNFADCAYVPNIVVEVVLPYLDVDNICREVRPLNFIATSDDYNFYVSAVDWAGEDTEIEADDISTDDLLVIAKDLEETYDEME
jgi:hypothetical protein